MMQVVLADDQADVRTALRLLLENEGALLFIHEVSSADDLLCIVKRFCPDVVLLDWELPGLHGKPLLDRLRSLCPNLNVIALSGRPESRQESLHDGVDTFVSKGDPPDELLRAIRWVRYRDFNQPGW